MPTARCVSIRGDDDDVLSHGFICPKAFGLKELREDPDRLRAPLVRRDGELREATWDEAFAEIDARLGPILEEHGRDAVAVYAGNPNAHNLAAMIYLRVFLRALGSKNIYSASSVDQMPKHFSAGHMFGHWTSIPVPDVDRTDHLMIWGANPLVSNGSLLTAPDMRGRIRRDPRARRQGRRDRPAAHADRRARLPSTTSSARAPTPWRCSRWSRRCSRRAWPTRASWPGSARGSTRSSAWPPSSRPERVADACGIPAAELRRMARELAAADRAAVYGRIGTTVQEFGTLASWLVDVLNVLSGQLRPAGRRDVHQGRRGAVELDRPAGTGEGRRSPTAGPAACAGCPRCWASCRSSALAEEIETPGEGQVRALVTVAGNPLVSTPERGPARAGGRGPRLHAQPGHLRERDQPPR